MASSRAIPIPMTRSGTSTIPGHKIAMPQPITDGAVEYKDGTPNTVDHYSRDIAAFLSWAAEPNLDQRRQIGLGAMIFLAVLAGPAVPHQEEGVGVGPLTGLALQA